MFLTFWLEQYWAEKGSETKIKILPASFFLLFLCPPKFHFLVHSVKDEAYFE